MSVTGSSGFGRVDRNGPRCSWRIVGKIAVVRAGVEDLRWPSFRSHPTVRLHPIGRDSMSLCPMNDTGFVAPDKQLGHGLQVRPAGDVCPHGGLITPEAGGPECAFTVSK